MDGGMIAFLSVIIGYPAIAGGVYRHQYIKTYRAYRRWQNEAPDDETRWAPDYGYGWARSRRADLSYYDYVNYKSDSLAPWVVGPFWLLLLIFFGLKAVLQPEVKIPSYNRIKELEEIDE